MWNTGNANKGEKRESQIRVIWHLTIAVFFAFDFRGFFLILLRNRFFAFIHVISHLTFSFVRLYLRYFAFDFRVFRLYLRYFAFDFCGFFFAFDFHVFSPLFALFRIWTSRFSPLFALFRL